MAETKLTLKDLLEAGAHFGHQTRRWNPKMGRFIFGARNGVHIIDLTHTSKYLEEARAFTRDLTSQGKTMMFVGTKRQAKPIVIEEATRAEMPYVAERWPGGMLTNFKTIRSRVDRLIKLEDERDTGEFSKYTKKEAFKLSEEIEDLNRVFGGIKKMKSLPDALFIIDIVREHIAVAEAIKLGIPVVAIVDTNADPDLVKYPIPSNDDAIKVIKAITGYIASAAAEGKSSAKSKAQDELVDEAAEESEEVKA